MPCPHVTEVRYRTVKKDSCLCVGWGQTWLVADISSSWKYPFFSFIGNYVLWMKKPSGRDAHLAEMKFAVNSTARAQKSRKRLFVLHGIIMSGETGWHRVKTPLTGKKFRSGAFFNNKIRAECELYCFDNMVLQQVIREWRLGWKEFTEFTKRQSVL